MILHLIILFTTNTLPQASLNISSIASLETILSNCTFISPLVNTSTLCSALGRYIIQITLVSSFSFMKCVSISIYFVLSCRTHRLWVIKIAALLSQYTRIGVFWETFNSSSSLFIHIPSHIPWARSLNSASVLLLATTFAFYCAKWLSYRQQMNNSLK